MPINKTKKISIHMEVVPVTADPSSLLVIAQVKVFKGSAEQMKAVMATLLEGIAESAPRLPEQTGQRLNLVA